MEGAAPGHPGSGGGGAQAPHLGEGRSPAAHRADAVQGDCGPRLRSAEDGVHRRSVKAPRRHPRMGIGKELKKRALSMSAKAMEKLMADEKRAMQIANAIGTVQRGKQALDKGQEEILRALNFTSKSDFKAVGKK